MMTPKEKAKELVDIYKDITTNVINYDLTKQCIFIAVDELINCTLPCCEFGGEINYCTSEYWIEVKYEVKKL